jgi:hypothetical protein
MDRSTVFFRKVAVSTFNFEDKGRTYLLTYSMEHSPSFQLVKKFPAFYGTRKFITAITSARSLTASQNDTFLRWRVVSISLSLQAGRPPLFGCPRLLIQYIGDRFSICKLRTRHAVVAGTLLSRTKSVFSPEMLLLPSSSWKWKAACFSEIVVTQYQTTRPHVYSHRRETPSHLGLIYPLVSLLLLASSSWPRGYWHCITLPSTLTVLSFNRHCKSSTDCRRPRVMQNRAYIVTSTSLHKLK